ncbi:MAG: hypothetical protein JO019_02360 [Candidatus Kaiserbacteria bacterium]|nr:hypothetical protein [Candidatus Kaiserbacteria bacterium]
MHNVRPALAVIGFLGAMIAPPWVPIACIVLLALRFRAIEAIAIGFFTDMLWIGAPETHALPLFTIASIIIVWGLEPLRLEFLR